MKQILTLISCLWSINGLAQTCNVEILQTSSEDRFIDNKNGTVTDVVTLSIWDKCSVGQQYNEGECIGLPTPFPEWPKALEYTASTAEKRLPNIKELSTLVERSCLEPAINSKTFPDTPLAIYWSSTPSDSIAQSGRVIDFTDGSEFTRDVNTSFFVRLIAK